MTIDYHVEFDTRYYSVPYELARQVVEGPRCHRQYLPAILDAGCILIVQIARTKIKRMEMSVVEGHATKPTPASSAASEPWGGDDTLLVLLDTPGPAQSGSAVDGITRLTKLMFLADHEAGFTGDENFRFVPHKYGPFSRDLYDALRTLRDVGLVEIQAGGGRDYYASLELADVDDPEVLSAARQLGIPHGTAPASRWLFRLTPKGEKVARSRSPQVAPDKIQRLAQVKGKYAAMPLNELLAYVYQRYPSYAQNSIHPLARAAR